MGSDAPRPVSLAEMVGTLSLVADLGMGRPMERVLRQTVIAMRLAAAAGMNRFLQRADDWAAAHGLGDELPSPHRFPVPRLATARPWN
jgi:hypothetical protein